MGLVGGGGGGAPYIQEDLMVFALHVVCMHIRMCVCACVCVCVCVCKEPADSGHFADPRGVGQEPESDNDGRLRLSP